MRQPFFIVGTGRSGSTLLQRLLAAHPRIALTNEGHVADFLYYCMQWAVVPQQQPQSFPLWKRTHLHGMIRDSCQATFSRVFERHAKQILEEFYLEHFADREFTHWGDKLPRSEVAVQLQHVYPDAKYVVLVRDVRDVCCSLDRFRERDGAPSSDLLAEQSLDDWAIYWNNSYAAFPKYLTHRQVVHYEDLVREPRTTIETTLAYLGLDGAERLVTEERLRAVLRGHGTSRSPLASIGRWRREMSPATARRIEGLCADTLKAYGYPVGELAD